MTDEKVKELIAKAIHSKNLECGGDSWEEMRQSGYECGCFEMANAVEAALAESGAVEPSAPEQVCNEIMEIMNEHDRQWPNVDTPGGLEHMGDVWKLLKKWNALLRASQAGSQ